MAIQRIPISNVIKSVGIRAIHPCTYRQVSNLAIQQIPRLRNMGIRQQFWESGCPDAHLFYTLSNSRFNKLFNDTKFVKIEVILLKVQ